MKRCIPGIRPLSPKLEAAARNNVNEVPERRQEDLAHIREWILTQPHLRARTDDAFLLIFLRGCKFNLEKTKEKIDDYYTYRTALPEFFSNRDPLLPELQTLLNTAYVYQSGARTVTTCLRTRFPNLTRLPLRTDKSSVL
ncbi:retinol-binding protein pinta [Anabrus simplex]|uniref:retinol-binding protein pinta n=1 Tax=Anabrus simplex TaxID=316456 RepID=UPI0035A39209